MSDALETLKTILKKKLPDDQVQALMTELIIASGKGFVAIDGDATEAVITGSQNIVGDHNRVVINQGTDPKELVKMLQGLLQEMQQVSSTTELSPEELRSATLAFLQDIETKFKETRLFHTKQPILLKDQYVPIQVTRKPHKRDVETLRGYWETEEELKRAYALKGGEEKAEEELKRQQMDWQEAKQKHQRIMVLADPGMGKSTLLRMEAGMTAEQELQKLEKNETTIDRLTLPLFLRLSELAKREEELIESIPFLIQRDYPNTAKSILPLLIEKLKTGKCLLLLDALDEVPKIDRNRIELQEKLDRFIQNYPCSVVCTSRIVGYDGNFLTGGQEVEIVPFGERQIDQYVASWFTNAAEHLSDGSVSAAALIRELRHKPQVKGLAQNPLLLSLICSLYQSKGLTLPTKRSQVYEESIKCMLSKWRIDNRGNFAGEAWVAVKRKLLTELAYQFSCNDQEFFSIGELLERVDHYRRNLDAPFDLQNHNLKTSDLINDLTEEDGIIQKLDRGSEQYSFLHRTFQEYFTARWFCERSDWDRLIKYIDKEHWKEVFLLSVESSLDADKLLLLMKKTIDEGVRLNNDLQRFLEEIHANAIHRKTWYESLDEVDRNCAGHNLHPLKNPTVMRALQLGWQIQSIGELDIASSIVQKGVDFLIDKRASNLFHIYPIHTRLAIKIDDSVNNVRSDILGAISGSESSVKLSRFLYSLISQYQSKFIEEVTKLVAFSQYDFREALISWWTLEEEEKIEILQALINMTNASCKSQSKEIWKDSLRWYYDVNNLMIDCLNLGDVNTSISAKVRKGIAETLLLPAVELEKPK